ncbi:MAG: acetylornithine deacetylase [Myxococcota bacterium]
MTLPDAVSLVRTLVAEPSVSSPDPAHDQPNRRVVERIAEWAEHLGFRCELVPLKTDPSKANLVATLGTGEGGLVLSGHSDTVPFDRAGWDTDPFDLVEKDGGRLYGLGSADMKGFFAAALRAAERFRPEELRRPLVLVATADEESTMNGARQLLAERRPQAARAVIGEPTGLAPVRAHKGILMERLTLLGRSGHSSDPSLGASALEGMHEALGVLLALRAELQAEHRSGDFVVPGPTLNLGKVEGGDSPNRICGKCQLTYDLRPLPGMDVARVRDRIRGALAERFAGDALEVVQESLAEPVPPFAEQPDATLVRDLESMTGRDALAVMFCTEAPFLQALGMETVVCGPGSIDVAHQPGEHTTRSQLEEAEALYARLIHRSCVEAA